jgi:hypothetical protein
MVIKQKKVSHWPNTLTINMLCECSNIFENLQIIEIFGLIVWMHTASNFKNLNNKLQNRLDCVYVAYIRDNLIFNICVP